MTKLESSMFTGLVNKGTLVLRFKKNNSTYVYPNVDQKLLDGLEKADSKGKYFIANIQKEVKDFIKL